MSLPFRIRVLQHQHSARIWRQVIKGERRFCELRSARRRRAQCAPVDLWRQPDGSVRQSSHAGALCGEVCPLNPQAVVRWPLSAGAEAAPQQTVQLPVTRPWTAAPGQLLTLSTHCEYAARTNVCSASCTAAGSQSCSDNVRQERALSHGRFSEVFRRQDELGIHGKYTF